jgi:class 3 adenylate cyclase
MVTSTPQPDTPLDIDTPQSPDVGSDTSSYSIGFDQNSHNNNASMGSAMETSVGQDLSSASLGSSKFDYDDTSELNELLQRQHLRGGLFGIIERLPLFCKLFLMLVIALVGLMGLGLYIIVDQSKTVKLGRTSKSIASLAAVTGQLISDIQDERDTGFAFSILNNTESKNEFLSKVTIVDVSISRLHSALKRYKLAAADADGRFLDQFYELIDTQKESVRQSALNGASARVTYSYYKSCTITLYSFLRSFTADLDPKFSRLVNALDVILQLQDNASTTAGAVTSAILSGVDSLRARSIISTYTNEDLLESLFLASAPDNIVEEYNTRVTVLKAPVWSILNKIALDPYNVKNYTNYNQWDTLANARLDAINMMEIYILSDIREKATKSMASGVTSITLLLFFITMLLLFSSASAIVFSKAITGPWRRIIDIQEQTMAKFIPKHFLRTLKCYRIADITLGKCIEREMTVMFADIRNFTGMSEGLTPAQNFNFLNKYLSHVGPIVRRQGGYIDKFMGDGFLACFANAQHAIKASLEMQEVITKLNIELQPELQIRVGMGLHCGRVMVGAIGENERMEGTMISDAVNLSSRLETLTKTFKSKILVSSDTMKRLRTMTDVPYRPLGFVKVKGKKQYVKVYELLDKSEPSKLEYMKEFKTGVENMIHHNFKGAIAILEPIVAKNPNDHAAVRVYDSCVMHQHALKATLKALQLKDVFADLNMREAFARFCSEERSEENYKFWVGTNEYSQTTDEVKRVIHMKKLYDNFLKLDSKHLVNTSDESKKQIEVAIADYQDRLLYPDATLFSKLQTEIEYLMHDTFARFKTSSIFVDIFKKSLPIPLVHVMDEDVL